MKTGVRVVALILAGLMAIGGLGSLFQVIARADTPSMQYLIDEVRDASGNVTYNRINDAGTKTPVIGNGRGSSRYEVDFTLHITDPAGTSLSQIKSGETNLLQVFLQGSSFSAIGLNDTKYTITNQSYNNGQLTYTIKLTGVQYSGTGNTLEVALQGKKNEADGQLMTDYTFVASAEVKECSPKTTVDRVDPDDWDNDSDSGSAVAVPTPYVIVSRYSYGSGQITAGSIFTLNLTFYNTSEDVDVENMMITVAMPEDLMLTSSSNTFYVDYLAAGQTVVKAVQVTAKPAAKPQSHDIKLSMKYQYLDWKQKTRKDNATEETISIPVVQVDRFQVTGIDSDVEFPVGQESFLTVNFVNKGRSDVYNISGEIKGNIMNPGQNQNAGNLASGATGSMDFYVIPEAEGLCTGEVLITYEDTNNQEQTISMPFSVQAVDYNKGMGEIPGWNEGMDPGMVDPGMEQKKPVWPFVAGAGGVIALIVAVIVLKKRKDKKRSEALDADL